MEEKRRKYFSSRIQITKKTRLTKLKFLIIVPHIKSFQDGRFESVAASKGIDKKVYFDFL